jgi:predicted MPP superfamily phosphohydrolase
VLLSHYPAFAVRAPNDRYPVVVAGNTFCGDVEVAGSPRLSWLREQVFPGATVEGIDRLFHFGTTTVVISCGTGYGFVPLRFGAAPEVVILTLVGIGAAAPEEEAAPSVADSLIERYQAAPPDSL